MGMTKANTTFILLGFLLGPAGAGSIGKSSVAFQLASLPEGELIAAWDLDGIG